MYIIKHYLFVLYKSEKYYKILSVHSMSNILAFLYYSELFCLYTVEPRFLATSVIRSPRYYGHFFWPPGWTTIHFLVGKSKKQKKTSLIWSPVNTANFFGPLVTVLTGFHCIKNTSGKKRPFRICARYARVVDMLEIEGVSSVCYLSISTEPKVNNR